jgi:acetyl esterase
MQELLQRIARAARAPLWSLNAQQARAAYEAAAGVLDVPPPRLAEVMDLDCPTRDGARLLVRRYRADVADATADLSSPPGALLYFHGGGFVIGSVATHDVLCRQLALHSGCTVFSCDYRLAPEHPFPMAVNDTWDALAWLRENAAMLGVDTERIAVGGDSAGGTLATVCAILARDAGWPLALQLLFYPGTAGWAQTASAAQFAHGFLLDTDSIDWFFNHYLARPQDRQDWRFAPLLAPNLQGVAPVWMGLAGCDPLHDEGVLYAERLRQAKVTVTLREWPGVTHEFIRMGRALPQAGQAVQEAATALRQACQPSSA